MVLVHFSREPVRCEQLLEADHLSTLLYCDLGKSYCPFNIPFFIFATRKLNACQSDQPSTSFLRIANRENANRVETGRQPFDSPVQYRGLLGVPPPDKGLPLRRALYPMKNCNLASRIGQVLPSIPLIDFAFPIAFFYFKFIMLHKTVSFTQL